jgi:DNA-binding CsgD family transcriptional regulator
MSGRSWDRTGGLVRRLERAESPAEVLAGAGGVLQQAFDAAAVFVASADPGTWLLTAGQTVDVPAAAVPLFLDNEYGASDVVKFRDLASGPHAVDTLHDRTRGDFRTSARWRHVLEPLGWGDEMRAALRLNGRTWGFVCVHRAAGDPPYTGADVRRLAALAPVFARELRRTSTTAVPGDARPGAEPGVLMLSGDGRLVARNDAAGDWLEELRAPGSRGVPVVLQALARSVRPGAPTTVHVQVASGRWATLHASWVAGDATGVSVVVGETRPDAAVPRLAMAAGLTPREQDVVAAVLRGQSTRSIADQLFISEHTVQTHLRSVFAKTGVHSRRELVARAMSGGPTSGSP